jgi:ribonuclease BN (tRNA processing enzyme)
MADYGGNTSCVEVVKVNKAGVQVPIIIDAGTGLIKLGYSLAGKLFSGEYSKTFTMLFTHLHPDHTEGFNFFSPNFFPFCTIHILGMETLKKNVGGVLKGKMIPPTFPIEYKDLKSDRKHGVLSDGQRFFIGQDGAPILRFLKNKDPDPLFEVGVLQSFAPSHPQQGAMYYRIKDLEDNSAIACIWDIESHIGGDVRAVRFAEKTDLMIHDAQYTEEEYLNTSNPVQGFGHSTFGMAMENAVRAQVRYLVPFHYNPRHTDAGLDAIHETLRKSPAPEVIMAKEGLALTLKDGLLLSRERFPSTFSK